ncbi:MAG TPA: fused MFS/spermidine synthase [Caldimonas sp.]|jgi:spermidine synthase|nr:fused MFS/spermidine synthase [Caldimonas sp.]
MNAAHCRRWRASLGLMMASGFAGLGYQVVWTQQGALWLGHEAASVLAVVTAFFGGIALGALAFERRIERSRRPLRWYVASEAVIAIWGAILCLVAGRFSAWAVTIVGVQPTASWQWTVSFVGTFVLLLPATAAMGATLPAIERVTASMREGGRSIAMHYAANTFGALLGVLATAFWLVPELGLARTAALCVALNTFCACAAGVVLPTVANASASASAKRVSPQFPTLARLAFTGLLGIGYEVLVVRVLGQVAEDTVYTFALLLAVYLVGTASGAAVYDRWWARRADAPALAGRLLAALSLACLAGSASLWGAEWLRDISRHAFGASMAAALASEALLAVVAFALPTFMMGALFSHLSRQASAEGVSFGRALGFNTLGAAAAAPLFGSVLAPLLGAKATLLIIASAYLALTPRAARWRPIILVPGAAALAMALLAPRLAFIDVPVDGHVVSYSEGVMASVSVVADDQGVARLRIDNRQQEGSSGTRLVDGRQALLPMLLHPAPRRALFLGLGTGITASTAAEDEGAEVDAVELLPEVIEASRHFTRAFNGGMPNTRLRLVAADARRYVRVAAEHYDVIVADNFHPARGGSGSLYTVEHFRAVRDRLAEHGVFCQWLPLHQLDLATVRSIVRSFVDVYPDGWALLASNSLETPVLGLVARVDGGHFGVAALGRRLRDNRFPRGLDEFGLDDELAVLGSFVAGPRALAAFAGDAPANTDDRPVVAYRAPRLTYAPDSSPGQRLSDLLHAVGVTPDELVTRGTDPEWMRRLAAYARARDRFIEAGRAVQPTANVQDMLAQVRAPLLATLRMSPDFRPAYDPLLRMALLLRRTDPDSANLLLAELARSRPAQVSTESAPRH